jgi:hypothetical protein
MAFETVRPCEWYMWLFSMLKLAYCSLQSGHANVWVSAMHPEYGTSNYFR